MARFQEPAPGRGGEGDPWEMVIRSVEGEPSPEGYESVRLLTSRGPVLCRHYPVPQARRGAVWVGGVGGGWDTPAHGLYPRLCQELTARRIASLRVQFRHPTVLEESVLDVLAGVAYLEGLGVEAVALTGHSFGGAVVIQAAAASDVVRTVVTLATQSYGAAAVSELGSRCSTLLLHGTADTVLPAYCSEHVFALAQEPRRLILYDGAGHGLDEVAGEVHQVVGAWVVEQLKRPRPA